MMNACEVHIKGKISYLISTPALDNILVYDDNKDRVRKIEMHGELESLFQDSSNTFYIALGYLTITTQLVKREKKGGYSFSKN